MGKQPDARTEWEVDAARRREVIAADFAGHRLRASDTEGEEMIATARRGLLATLQATLNSAPAKVDDVPCDHAGALTPVKPGA